MSTHQNQVFEELSLHHFEEAEGNLDLETMEKIIAKFVHFGYDVTDFEARYSRAVRLDKDMEDFSSSVQDDV